MVFEPPARKFVRVVKDSLVKGKEDLYRDAGLAFGRSFRVGWGPGGTLVHLGALCGPRDAMFVLYCLCILDYKLKDLFRTPPESLSVITISQLSVNTEDEDVSRCLLSSEYTYAL